MDHVFAEGFAGCGQTMVKVASGEPPCGNIPIDEEYWVMCAP